MDLVGKCSSKIYKSKILCKFVYYIKYMLRRLYIIISVFTISLGCFAQDIHLSQFESSPLNLNPALTGLFDCDYRFVGNHRNQWQSITANSYKTYSFSFDTKLKWIKLQKSYIGVGILLNTDKAGDSQFGTTQIKFNAAFHKYFKEDSSMVVSIGMSGNYNQNTINYDKLNFGSQYTGSQYNANLPSGETFNTTNLSYFDFTMGLNLICKIKNKIPVNMGFSLFHLNRSLQSFNGEFAVLMDRRWILHGGSSFNIKSSMVFLPSFFIMNQGRYLESELGGLLKIKTTGVSFKAIYFGGWYRVGDAGIIKFAMDYKNWNIGISYDINTSGLTVASNGQGGLELSAIYRICTNKRKIIVPYKKQCPVYI